MVKISVIIPVYNVENYLAECLDSVCAQTLNDLEIICINDGSTDKSSDILADYAKKDSRIKVITQELKGVSAARNVGIKAALGEYIAFVDSDDRISENFYEVLYTAAIKENADICGCGFKIIKKNKEKKRLKYNKSGEAYSLNEKFKLFGMPLYNYVWNKIYKRQMLLDAGVYFEEGRIHEDRVWSCLIMKASGKAIVVPDVWYFYRLRQQSLVHTTFGDPKREEDLKWAKNFQEEFIKQNHLDVETECFCKTKILFLGLPIGKIEERTTSKRFYILGIKILELKYKHK